MKADIRKATDEVRANIRRIRKQKRLTAEVVAVRIGISRPFYTQLEGGTRRLSLRYLIGIARALEVRPGSLLDVI
jgi:transcriptional regulator with XRE-family HTH domain